MTKRGIWMVFLLFLVMVLILAFVDFGPDINDTLYTYGFKTFRLEEVAPDPESDSSFYREGGWILNGYQANYRIVAILVVLGAIIAYLSSKRINVS